MVLAVGAGLWFFIQRLSKTAGEALTVASFGWQPVRTWMCSEESSLRWEEDRREGGKLARCDAVVLAAVAACMLRFNRAHFVSLLWSSPKLILVGVSGRVLVCAHEDGMTTWGARSFVRYCVAVVERLVWTDSAGLKEDCGGCAFLDSSPRLTLKN